MHNTATSAQTVKDFDAMRKACNSKDLDFQDQTQFFKTVPVPMTLIAFMIVTALQVIEVICVATPAVVTEAAVIVMAALLPIIKKGALLHPKMNKILLVFMTT